jgi:hypothetical protein
MFAIARFTRMESTTILRAAGEGAFYVLQRCTHPRFQRCEIGPIHAAQGVIACVLTASNTGGSDECLPVIGSSLGVSDSGLKRSGGIAIQTGKLLHLGSQRDQGHMGLTPLSSKEPFPCY